MFAKSRIVALITASGLALTGAVFTVTPVSADTEGMTQRQLVPAYFYPDLEAEDSRWRQMCDGQAASVGLVVIFNPENGPGANFIADYARAVEFCTAAGQSVIGYAHTTYGQRRLNRVKADVDAYYARYPQVDGIFVDEMSNDPLTRRYYRNLYTHIKAKSGGRRFVVGNPGAAAPTDWQLRTPVADNVVVFEGSLTAYEAWDAPTWTTSADSSRISHLVHEAAGLESLSLACAVADERNAGMVYVTDDQMPNPWDSLPDYWSEEPTTC